MPNDPYCVAFDPNGRNLYIGNKISQTIEVVRTHGAQLRSTIAINDDSPTAVAQPAAIALDSDQGERRACNAIKQNKKLANFRSHVLA